MLLMGVKEENGWLCSQWNLTYGTGWTEITKAVKTAYPYYENVEVLVDNRKVDLQSAEDVLCLEEGGDMVIRGTSTVIKVPMMVKFYNQLQRVDVWVACATDEFKEADYKSFNLSMGGSIWTVWNLPCIADWRGAAMMGRQISFRLSERRMYEQRHVYGKGSAMPERRYGCRPVGVVGDGYGSETAFAFLS